MVSYIINDLSDRLKILVIDGNEETSSLLSEYLKNKGHQCFVINNGRNGLESLEKNDYDMILLELNLPGLSGYDIIDALANTGRINEQNIVILTSEIGISEKEIAELKEKGVKSFLEKPLNIDLLMNELKLQSSKNSYHELKWNVGGKKTYPFIHKSTTQESSNQKIKELQQQLVLLKEIKENHKQKGKTMEEKLNDLKHSLESATKREKEIAQVEVLSENISGYERKKLLQLSKKFYTVIVLVCIGAASGIGGYSYYENQLFLETVHNNLADYKDQYLVQNLNGEIITTWVAWNIPSDRVIYVDIVNQAGVGQDEIDAIKDAILSKNTVQIDNSLINKGPKGSFSTYYVGWVGALEDASKTYTELYIPKQFEVSESSSGTGDIIVTLSPDINPDGYTGLTKSISDEHQILRSTVTIFGAQGLSIDQLKVITRHEIGHTLGIAYSTNPQDLMHLTIQTPSGYISDCDISAIRSLYNGSQTSQVSCP
jgi:DNA-binding response OmpR family regulator